MKLRLHKVYFKNWKCYLAQEVVFNWDSKKNILVFYGQNGSGKTSFQEGILWCLYGDDAVSREKLSEYFNRVNQKTNPELELSVSLTFIDDLNTYTVTRTASRTKRGNTFYPKVEDAEFYLDGKRKEDAKERIESLLPRSCREFFFFDGEKIKEYAKLTHTDETRKAIERTLGIPEIKNLRDDAEGTVEKFENKLKEASKTQKELNTVAVDLAKLKQEIIAKQGQLKKIRDDLQQEKKFLTDTEARANQIDELSIKQKEIDKDKLKQKDWEKQVQDLNTKLQESLTRSPIYMLSDLAREITDDVQSKKVATTRISVSTNLLRELIDRDTCLCGRCFNEDAYNYIQEQIRILEQAESSGQEEIELHEIDSNLKRLSNYKATDLKELLSQRDLILDEIEELKQSINRKEKETEGFNQKEAREIWEKRGTLKANINNQENRIKRIEQEIKDLEQKENQLKRKREHLASLDRSNSTLNKQLNLANGLKEATNELIEWYIKNCRETIEEYASRIHLKINNKPDEYVGVKVKQDYTLAIQNVNNDLLNPENISEGEKEILAFAFIASLNLASGRGTPLIMDTPFARLDTTHQKNILNSLPDIPAQVIVLATDRDLPDNLLNELRPYVAQIHRVSRLGGSEDASAIEVEE